MLNINNCKYCNTSGAAVLGLTIINVVDKSKGITCKDKILLCIRDPLTNINHPNVVSVPTQRIPMSLYRDIISSADSYNIQSPYVLFNGDFISNDRYRGNNPVIFSVEATIFRKISIFNDGYINGGLCFDARLISATSNVLHYPRNNGKVISEYVNMLNIIVYLYNPTIFPANSWKYSNMKWVEIGGFLEAFNKRDVSYIGVDMNIIGCDIYGLCVSSSFAALNSIISNI